MVVAAAAAAAAAVVVVQMDLHCTVPLKLQQSILRQETQHMACMCTVSYTIVRWLSLCYAVFVACHLVPELSLYVVCMPHNPAPPPPPTHTHTPTGVLYTSTSRCLLLPLTYNYTAHYGYFRVRSPCDYADITSHCQS